MTYNDFDKEFIKMLENNPEKYFKDFLDTKDKVSKSTAIYKNKPVPFLLHPMFWSKEDVDSFKDTSEMITTITDKITDRYFTDKDYRKLFNYSENAEKLILREKGYSRNVPIGRFDIFYKSPKEFKFCEINTDGSSAMNEDNTIGKILLESLALNDFSEKYDLFGFELIESWVDKLLDFYKEWGGTGKPNIAIIDFKASGTTYEFNVFKAAIEDRGYRCEIVDPVDTVYKNGKLYYGDYRIDLVYRRLVTFELLERIDEIGEFIEAYMDNAFCSVGEIRSQIMHNKESFRVIKLDETLSFMNQKEKEFIQEHFLDTGILSSDIALVKNIKENKDKYVIKPNDKNASQGVFIGADFSKEEWGKRIDENTDNEYLYQEFYKPIKRHHAVFEDGKLVIKELGSVVGLFIYDGVFQGIYTRVSENNLISGLTDYFTLPNLLCLKK